MMASEYYKTVTLIGFLYQSFLSVSPLPTPHPPFFPEKCLVTDNNFYLIIQVF